MTLHKLSAGSGYEYLTRRVAALDSTEKGHVPLTDYYSAKGESPGIWVGSGLTGIEGIDAGDEVTAEQMLRLFGHGLHPVDGERLGRPYRLYDNHLSDDFRAMVARRVKSLNAEEGQTTRANARPDLRARARTDVARELFAREHGREPTNARELDAALKRYSRPARTAVAGFDLTFSPVKSVSTLWALVPREVAAVIEKAHQAAVSDALGFIEREALFTREGLNGARQVETRGLIATAFTHRDSRAGDPDLHTHVAVANKVQTADGKWLAIYGRVLYESAVAASETYNTALERHLSEKLGVQFADRPSTERGKRPVREIIGVDQSLNHQWSKRRRDIDVRRGELARDFQRSHGRPPTPAEAIALAQRANLETRDAKHEPRSLAEQRTTWRTEAADVLGSETVIDRMVVVALDPPATTRETVSVTWVHTTAERVVAELETHRATWKVTHVRAEAQRQARGLDVESGHLDAVIGWVIDDVLERLSVNLTPDPDPVSDPDKLRRSDATSVYRHSGRDIFTSQRILDAEQRITTAAGREDGRRVPVEGVEVALLESAANGVTLNAGQAALVREMAISGRRVQVGIAAAGSGKTTAMRTLARTWAEAGGDVIGLAPSAAAAAALQAETGIVSDTLAKLVHDLDRPSPPPLSIGSTTLVVIDEAGMADTLTLDRVIDHALARGASVRLIGDDRQLSAVGAGGVLRDVSTTHGAVRLDELMRFSDPAEATASLALRDGDAAAFGFYFDQDRVHVGDSSTCTDAVFEAWSADRHTGLDSLMLAPTRDLVSELNHRARDERLDGATPIAEVDLADGNRASVGDTILTRRNDRRLAVSATDWVKNGDRWTITDISDGSLAASHTASGLHVRLPASYVAEHVELGYASTVHTAQGLTADTMHGIVTGSESRQMLYTMMTRGRHANHVHLAITADGDPHQMLRPESLEPATTTETLEAILARDGAAVSASTTAREADSPAVQLHDASARYTDAVHGAAEDVIGPARIHQIAQQAETLMPGLTQDPVWASLAAQLSLIEASGHDARDVLTYAVTYRTLDGVDEPALVLGWRLHLHSPTDGGPLPWLPAIPTGLTDHPTWGGYLAERAHHVDDLAAMVRTAANGTTPGWLPNEVTLTPGLRSDVAVWRAAHSIPDSDRRPTGPKQVDFAVRDHQHMLDQCVSQHLDRQGVTWIRPIAEIVGRQDSHTPVLADRLASLAEQGHDVHRLLDAAGRQGHLPDDHATAALDSRITRQVTDEKRAADAKRQRDVESPWSRTGPSRGGPGIGL